MGYRKCEGGCRHGLGETCAAVRLQHWRLCELTDPGHPDYNPAYLATLATETPAPPTLLGKAIGFAAAAARHVAAGCPTVTDEEKARRLAICRACPNFDAGHESCRLCGCNLRLKSSWALSQCPDTPPRWTAVTAGPSAP